MSPRPSTKRVVWEWEGENIGVRGAESMEDAIAMVLEDRDLVDGFDLEDELRDFPKGWDVKVWRVPAIYFSPLYADGWEMGHIDNSSFDEGPGRGYVRVVWFTVPR